MDRNSGLKFFVDSGADVSLLPACSTTKGSCDYKLHAANMTEIPTFGIKVLTVDLGLRRPFQWPFIVAKVSKGILGADFLNQFHLLIDIKKKQLIDGKVSSDIMSIGVDHVISTINNSLKFAELLCQYPNNTKPNVLNKQTKRNVKHYICTKGQPVYARARQLDAYKLKLAKQEFKFMLDNNIIRPSKSQWASPLHLVNKKDGTLKPCEDYRLLNAQTDEDKPKTAIITPFGLFEFNVMSFGLRNAPSTFQRFVHEVIQGLDFVFPYLDDVLIASSSGA
ncbi:uncharacterized protein K02A2.6-like [Stegodyphus dumicola]|uniref:uncharacterized protein K02A2.6-like n=1 Tax=Stegodyphus dumicola TaxID=202533 RepID=UPI0015AF12D3|nr:uncharacterized protein K02A2.6-like [Stegodyphus dumicola]